jgi:hypothetical protein
MSRDLNLSTISDINKDTVYPFFAAELQFDGNNLLRMWTGQGTLVLENGTQWIGLGQLLSISAIEETAEMAVKGATLTLSGVPQSLLSLALSNPYQGRVCKIYFGTFTIGQLLQQSSSYILLQDGSRIDLQSGAESSFSEIFSGYMDQMNVEEGPESSTIELTVENKLIDLERARTSRFTNFYQKSVYPNDKGLEFVEDLQDRQIPWGRISEETLTMVATSLAGNPRPMTF